MEKLIELLNEYDPYIARDGELMGNYWYFIFKGGSAIFPKEIGMLKIISKEYGFIKWLVENDKIDERKCWNASFELYHTSYTKYESLLMLLSIQEEPVKFLSEILK